jgi:hypothetical protein
MAFADREPWPMGGRIQWRYAVPKVADDLLTLVLADEHIARTERLVAEQAERVERLNAMEAADMHHAQHRLRVLCNTLAILQWQRKVVAETVEAIEEGRPPV